MMRLLRADFCRMYRSRWFFICVGFMLLMAAGFVMMQCTAFDYTVGIDRVIFLPMSFYGVAAAALVSLFVGEDFSDGFIRNKLIAGRARHAVFLSNVIVSVCACVTVYLLTTAATLLMSFRLFEINVTAKQVLRYVALGALTCAAYASIYGVVSMLLGNKTTSVVVCMGLAFFMLFLCLNTNQMIVQQPYKNGLPNPHYLTGFKRTVYELLHDLNPSGQAAQLSAMTCLNPLRWVLVDVLWFAAANGVGALLFAGKDIR